MTTWRYPHENLTHEKCLDNKWPSEGQQHLKTTQQRNISNTSSSSCANWSEHPQNTQQENLRQNSIRGDRTTRQETFIICEYWPSDKHWLVLTRRHNVSLPGSHRIHLSPLCLCVLGVQHVTCIHWIQLKKDVWVNCSLSFSRQIPSIDDRHKVKRDETQNRRETI